ncbi:uncharacterized protein F5891DRAFT_989842 [Suillus fuscotomentosus]|uniref:Uncharacterized protein n=1 Tax=Suillus fuscotomentosus TaxID=1912939 RepID=A0AAD4DN21_9AGAM|nr:uncharacterized protein F5891DRAFT_989842 [Suillus fuscotomentosus]KAG1885281.1 hypothetical protein F5891DRAFT_989842 [Suillus fuscotomentosus]
MLQLYFNLVQSAVPAITISMLDVDLHPSEMRQTLFLKEMGFHVQGEVWSGLQAHPGTARWTIRETSGVQLASLEVGVNFDKLVERTRDSCAGNFHQLHSVRP